MSEKPIENGRIQPNDIARALAEGKEIKKWTGDEELFNNAGVGPQDRAPQNVLGERQGNDVGFKTKLMPQLPEDFQAGYYGNGITQEMINNCNRQTYGPITLSNGAIYTGELLNGMKDGYGQQQWQLQKIGKTVRSTTASGRTTKRTVKEH